MKTFKIRIVTKFNTKNELFIPGEEHEARRLSYNFMDFKTPFQIVSGKKSGEEVPFKYAVVVPEEIRPTQQQFDRLVEQNRELLNKLERHTDEQLNSEKLLQRIRELETIAQGRDEMIKSLRAELEDVRSTLKPVELPYVTVKAMNIYFKNDRRREEKEAALLNILCSSFRELTTPARHIKEHFSGDCLRLAESVVLGYSVAEEKDELSEEIDRLTEKWFQEILKSGSDIETNRQDLNKVIYEFMRGQDKKAV